MSEFQGKVVIVTGGAKGIGKGRELPLRTRGGARGKTPPRVRRKRREGEKDEVAVFPSFYFKRSG